MLLSCLQSGSLARDSVTRVRLFWCNGVVQPRVPLQDGFSYESGYQQKWSTVTVCWPAIFGRGQRRLGRFDERIGERVQRIGELAKEHTPAHDQSVTSTTGCGITTI